MDERSVTEIDTKQRMHHSKNNYHSTYLHPTTIYYNSNHQYHQAKQHFPRSSSSTIQHRSQNNDRFHYYHQQQQQQPIRPLMEIKDNQFSLNDNTITYSNSKPREPKQRGQYRNRKAELDWDHAFDLDQLDLYITQNDTDNYSLTSIHSSGDNSLSSV
ncbi:unnamed protein product [Rotaria sp. Silwood1]|nr:unnamed protein product [Rotaria sp. Silwood1]